MELPKCSFCLKDQKALGALLFSAPDPLDKVMKLHVCVECYVYILNLRDLGHFGCST